MITKQRIVYMMFVFFLGYFSSANASLSFLKGLVAHSHPNCPKAKPIDHPQFCASFQTAAQCQCTSFGLPKSMCKNMASLYKHMLSIFTTLQQACEYQQDTPAQHCIDGWNCYMFGSKKSDKQLCGSTGNACL